MQLLRVTLYEGDHREMMCEKSIDVAYPLAERGPIATLCMTCTFPSLSTLADAKPAISLVKLVAFRATSVIPRGKVHTPDLWSIHRHTPTSYDSTDFMLVPFNI